MIAVVSGKVGSGKSYHLCKMAIDHMCAGGVVATNMNIDLDKVMRIYHRALLRWQLVKVDAASDPRKIPAGDLRGRGRRRVLVILDEALNWFASSAGSKDERKSTWGEWLRQSDKLGQDVFFIAQDFGRAAKWIRELAQVAYRITNFGNFHIFRAPVGKWLHLDRFYALAKYEVSSLSLLSIWTHWIDMRVCSCYVTAELFGFQKPEDGYLGSVPPPFKVPFWPVFYVLGLFCWAWWLYA